LGKRRAVGPQWRGQLRAAEAECRQAGAEAALAAGRFEEAAGHLARVAECRGTDPEPGRARVVEAMLGEARRLFAAGDDAAATGQVMELLGRVPGLGGPRREAEFGRGLCRLRGGEDEAALADLTAAHAQAGGKFLDPGLYRGMVLLRGGRPQEALRALAEANRLDPGCPLVACHLGV